MSDADSNAKAVARSVNDRLKAVARARGGDINKTLIFLQRKFFYERFLARVIQTPARERWVLKGGVLMLTLNGVDHRMTQDTDFSMRNGPKMSVTDSLREACATAPIEEDGVRFTLVEDGPDAPHIIREDSINPTVRATVHATLICERPVNVSFLIDVTPDEAARTPVIREWMPTVRGFSPLEIPSYSWELVLAEKLHAIITGSEWNRRLRDFADVIALQRSGEIDDTLAAEALVDVFQVRGHANKLSTDAACLTESFAINRQNDWMGTMRRTGYAATMPESLLDAVNQVKEYADKLIRTPSFTPSL